MHQFYSPDCNGNKLITNILINYFWKEITHAKKNYIKRIYQECTFFLWPQAPIWLNKTLALVNLPFPRITIDTPIDSSFGFSSIFWD